MDSVFNFDLNVPYWKSRVDLITLFEQHAHRPEKAAAWLEYHGCTNIQFVANCALMRGIFNLGILTSNTYTWTFTPGIGDTAVVLPVVQEGRLADLVAISRHNQQIWGCVTGYGSFIGRTFPPPLRVHRHARSWIAENCNGVLPLSKSFLPRLQAAPSIIADDYEHAQLLAHRGFIDPAADFGNDEIAAAQRALDSISFEVTA